MKRFIAAALALASAGTAAIADNVPYVVGGYTHMLIGVTMHEAGVREMLPKGLEPAEGITGGMQVYASDGGEGMAVTQYAFAGKFCGGELLAMTVAALPMHPLTKLKIRPAGWVAVDRDLSFSATPAMPLPKGE